LWLALAFPSLLNDKIIREKGSKLEVNHGTTSEVANHECLKPRTLRPAYFVFIASNRLQYFNENRNNAHHIIDCSLRVLKLTRTSVVDQDPNPDPSDPYVFGLPGSGSFYHHAKIVRKTLIPTVL